MAAKLASILNTLITLTPGDNWFPSSQYISFAIEAHPKLKMAIIATIVSFFRNLRRFFRRVSSGMLYYANLGGSPKSKVSLTSSS